MRHRLFRRLFVIVPSFLLLMHPFSHTCADPSLESLEQQDTVDVLQNSLSIVEIDHEIKRTEDEQNKIAAKQQELKIELAKHKQEISKHEERAGAIIRSYYMGDRDQLLRIFLRLDSFRSLQVVASYYEMIISSDQDTLRAYQNKYKQLQSTSSRLDQSASELAELKQNLIYQKERISALEKEVEDTLASSNQRETMEKLIKELTSYWNNTGINEVKRYFNALADAMENLPTYIQNEPGIIAMNGSTYTIRITETQLNDFLRSENEIFNDFSFRFTDQYIIASGKKDDLELAVQGHYTVINDPENGILFHVDKLIFNQFELPDTTRNMLEEEFDLGFYPQKLMSFIKATDVSTKANLLEVTMELSLKSSF